MTDTRCSYRFPGRRGPLLAHGASRLPVVCCYFPEALSQSGSTCLATPRTTASPTPAPDTVTVPTARRYLGTPEEGNRQVTLTKLPSVVTVAVTPFATVTLLPRGVAGYCKCAGGVTELFTSSDTRMLGRPAELFDASSVLLLVPYVVEYSA